MDAGGLSGVRSGERRRGRRGPVRAGTSPPSASPPVPARPLEQAGAPGRRGLDEDLRVLLVAALLGTAAVHGLVSADHLEHWPAAGVSFRVLAVAEALLALGLVRRLSRRALVSVVVVSALPLVVWVVSRIAGLPLGPDTGVPEPVGWADGAVAVLEIGTGLAALALLRLVDLGRGRPAAPPHWSTAGLVAVAALSAVGMAASTADHHTGEPGPHPPAPHAQPDRR